MEIRQRILDEQLSSFDGSQIKAVAIDIDGTLINSEGICTDRTVNAIRELQESGRHVFLITGRGVSTAISFAKQCNIQKYMINYNGAVIWDLTKSQKEYEICLDSNIVKDLLKIIRNEDLFFIVYSNDQYHYEIDSEDYANFSSHLNVEGVYLSFDDIPAHQFQKILVNGPLAKIEKLQKEINKKCGNKLHMNITTPRIQKDENDPYFYLEIMDNKVNKGATLLRLLNILGIDSDQVVAFGDDTNDIEMLTSLKWGIAMGNARPPVRDAVFLHTLTNDEHGVAYFIEKYILSSEL